MGLTVYIETKKCPTCGHYEEVYSQSITHNMTKMAKKAGIFQVLWRQEETGLTKAKDLMKPLEEAIKKMKKKPKMYKGLESPCGYGTYENFLQWMEKLLEVCSRYPDHEYNTCR